MAVEDAVAVVEFGWRCPVMVGGAVVATGDVAGEGDSLTNPNRSAGSIHTPPSIISRDWPSAVERGGEQTTQEIPPIALM